MNIERISVAVLSRLYGWMLSAYPRAHLRRYREDMLQVFSDGCREALRRRGVWGVPIILMQMLLDTGSNAVAEHLAERGAYMSMLQAWYQRKVLNTEKFDPFWGGFFMGIVSCANVATGVLLIVYSDGVEALFWMGCFLLAGAAFAFGVQMLQLREYNKRLRAGVMPITSEFRLR